MLHIHSCYRLRVLEMFGCLCWSPEYCLDFGDIGYDMKEKIRLLY